LPQPQKQIVTYFISFFFLRAFGRFVTTGVQKHEKYFFRKKASGLITKDVAFFSSVLFFPPSWLLCSIFLSRFWAFRNKGSTKKRDEKGPAKIS
jgi:hypothetical protein